MATEINLRATLDQTSIMSEITSIRSQIGMALSTPTGFQTPATGIVGSGPSGVTDFGGGAASGMRQMMASFAAGNGYLGGSGFGGTFTNSNMAYSPHYGAVQANTSLAQEMRIHQYGGAAAQEMKPPGVSSTAYMLGVESNYIDRRMQAEHQAQFQARAAFYTGVGGLAAGEAGGMVGAAVGGVAGSAIATRLFGAGAAGAGKFVGGLALGWMAFDKASDYVGGKIQDHYAEVEQTRGVYRELGEIAGAGRGLNRSQRVELGIAATGAAGDLKMDVQQMGDTLALGRQAGMLPSATDPTKAREQFREFARTIEEGAQILQTSLAGATQVIKTATAHGMTAQEGIVKAAAMGGPEAFGRYMAFGNMGAQVGRSMGYTGAQGFGMFTGSVGAASGAGLSGEEMKIMGGRYGAAQFLGATQMAAAQSPMGDMQLMAATGGGALGGMMELPGQAMAAMAEGGDFMSNMGSFMVHRNELRRGIGAKGIRAMARQQVVAGGEMIQDLMPGMSERDSQRFFAEYGLGMSNDQAKLYAGGVGKSGGGPGSGARGQARAVMAMQGTMLERQGVGPARTAAEMRSEGSGFGLGYALEGGMIGGMTGSIPGAVVGAVGGFVAGNIGAAIDLFGGDHPPAFSSAEDKAKYYERKAAKEYDDRMSKAKERIGYVDLDEGVTARFLTTDLSRARISGDALGNARLSGTTAASLYAAGLSPVEAGAGTIEFGGEYWSTAQVQKVAGGKLYDKPISEKERTSAIKSAYEAVHSDDAANRYAARRAGSAAYGRAADGEVMTYLENVKRLGTSEDYNRAQSLLSRDKQMLRAMYKDLEGGGQSAALAAQGIRATLGEFAENVQDVEERNRLKAAIKSEALGSDTVHAFARQALGTDIARPTSAAAALIGGSAAASGHIASTGDAEVDWLAATYPGAKSKVSHRDTQNRKLDYVMQRFDFGDLSRDEVKQALRRSRDGMTDLDRYVYAEDPYGLPEVKDSKGALATARGYRRSTFMGGGEMFLPTGKTPTGMYQNFAAYNEAVYGAREIHVGQRKARQEYMMAMKQDPQWIEAKEAAVAGKTKRVQELVSKIEMDLRAKPQFANVKGDLIDVTEKVYVKKDAEKAINEARAEAVLSNTWMGQMAGMEKIDTKELEKKIEGELGLKKSLVDIMAVDVKDTKQDELAGKRKRRRGSGTMSRTIGWGAKEDAMSSVNRSLRHTERSLKAQQKQIEALTPKPQ